MPSTNTLPPPPIREPIFSGQQYVGAAMNQIWVNWFTQLFQRVGKGTAATTSDLEVLSAYAGIAARVQTGNVANLQAEFDLLEAEVSDLNVLTANQQDRIRTLEILQAFP